jgi:transposase
MKKRKPYTVYTKEFKLEAIRLMREGKKPASEIAMELGIRRNQLYKWEKELVANNEEAFSGRGRPSKANQSEVATLKQENDKLREEVEILKKAAAYFARELK